MTAYTMHQTIKYLNGKIITLLFDIHKTWVQGKLCEFLYLIYSKALIDQFIYLRSNISSTEGNVNICIGKVSTANDKLSTIWKLDF